MSNNRSSIIGFLLFVGVVINKLFAGKYPQVWYVSKNKYMMWEDTHSHRIKVLNELKYSGG